MNHIDLFFWQIGKLYWDELNLEYTLVYVKYTYYVLSKFNEGTLIQYI